MLLKKNKKEKKKKDRQEISCQIYFLTPRPLTYTVLKKKRIKVKSKGYKEEKVPLSHFLLHSGDGC